MKMDEKYFDKAAFNVSADVTVGDTASLFRDLKQIARDQREADMEKVESAIAEHFGDENEAFYFRAHGVGCDILAALREEE